MQEKNKNIWINGIIIGSNLLLMFAYNVYWRSRIKTPLDVFMTQATLIVLHIFICIVLAAIFYNFRKAFFLSAGLILLIGFATCYSGS